MNNHSVILMALAAFSLLLFLAVAYLPLMVRTPATRGGVAVRIITLVISANLALLVAAYATNGNVDLFIDGHWWLYATAASVAPQAFKIALQSLRHRLALTRQRSRRSELTLPRPLFS